MNVTQGISVVVMLAEGVMGNRNVIVGDCSVTVPFSYRRRQPPDTSKAGSPYC